MPGMTATERQQRWRYRSDNGIVAVTIEVDTMIVDALAQRGFLPSKECYERAEIAAAAIQALRTLSRYA
jgi:hypothetical protein